MDAASRDSASAAPACAIGSASAAAITENGFVARLLGALGAWAVALANVASAAAMIWFVVRRHPGAVERLRAAWYGN